MERLHDACGVVGIYAQEHGEKNIDVRRYLTLALSALQHRGQESAGMAVYDNEGNIFHRAGMGKVREVFSDSGASLPVTHCGIGHARYSTTGSSCVENAGPFVVGTEASSYESPPGNGVFNNTIFQPNGEGANGLGGETKPIKHCVSRNNVFQARSTDTARFGNHCREAIRFCSHRQSPHRHLERPGWIAGLCAQTTRRRL